jgi:hypothetical protein
MRLKLRFKTQAMAVEVPDDIDLPQLRMLIDASIGIPAQDQRFYSGGLEITEQNAPLKSLGVTENTTLFVWRITQATYSRPKRTLSVRGCSTDVVGL